MNIRPNVAMVEIAGRGGIFHYTCNLISALEKFVNVALISAKEYELDLINKNINILRIFNGYRTNPLFFSKIFNFLSTSKTNIIHFQLSQHPLFILCMIVLVRLREKHCKIIVTAHNAETHEKVCWEFPVYKAIYSLADKLIVHANHNRFYIGKKFSIDINKIHVIPHGNYMFFRRKDIVMKNNCVGPDILFFGFIRRYKGLEYLIKALKIVKEEIPNVRLLIVGKPVESFDRYQLLIDNLGLAENVEKHLGYIPSDRISDFFERTSLVVLPYLNIYQSGVLQIAYSFSKPVVATDVGGFPEAVEDGKSGFIVPPKESGLLADRIIRILKDDCLREAMGKFAENLAMKKYSWENIAEKTLSLYV